MLGKRGKGKRDRDKNSVRKVERALAGYRASSLRAKVVGLIPGQGTYKQQPMNT